MALAREAGHVGADLGDDVLGAAPLDSRDRAEELNGPFERGDLCSDHLGEPLDLLVEEVEVGEDRTDQQRMQLIEAALKRLAQRRQLLAQLPGVSARRAARGPSCRRPARRASRGRS